MFSSVADIDRIAFIDLRIWQTCKSFAFRDNVWAIEKYAHTLTRSGKHSNAKWQM